MHRKLMKLKTTSKCKYEVAELYKYQEVYTHTYSLY